MTCRPRSDRVRHRSMEAPLLHTLSEQARLSGSAWAGPHGSAWAEAPSSPWPDEEIGAGAPRPQVSLVSRECVSVWSTQVLVGSAGTGTCSAVVRVWWGTWA